MRNLRGKTVAITGCTGGIGRELCLQVAKLGADIIMLDRNQNKSRLLESEIKSEYPTVKITRIELDLSNIASVKQTSKRLTELNPDVFIPNAGAYSIPRYVTEAGLDNVFQINFAAPYYIIHKLTASNPDIKTVAVGSIAHNYSKSDKNDFDFHSKKSAEKVYGNSKRYLMFSLYKLFENKANLAVTHPGITFTNITAHYPKFIFAIIKHPMKIIFMKPKNAAQSIIEGIFTSTAEGYWIGPELFDIWGKPKYKKLKSYNQREAEEIFKKAEEIYNSIDN